MHQPTWSEFLKYWLVFGFKSFGGPGAQIAMLQRDLVEKRSWLTAEDFAAALSFVSILPGPEAHQLATFIGRKKFGVTGGVVAGGLFLIPSFLLIVFLTFGYLRLGTATNFDTQLAGLRAGVVGVIAFTVWRLSKSITWRPMPVLIVTITLLLGVFTSWSVVGIVLVVLALSFFITRGVQSERLTGIGLARKPLLIALSVFGASIAVVSFDQRLMSIAVLFTQAALITFGGAYSVLPFVFDRAVNDFGWLTTQQMLDGLVLGEATPGPLIMVNAFVGYIAGSGFWGALVATWFTFVPSFFLVFIFAPVFESIAHHQRVRAILALLSSMVVGLIATLALDVMRQLPAADVVTTVLVAALTLTLLIVRRIPILAALCVSVVSYTLLATI